MICDVWGVLHDGVRAFPGAAEQLARWRSEGRRVVLLTNAPRPSTRVALLLDRLGVGPECYDRIVSSGDAGVAYLRERCGDRPVAMIGTSEDAAALAEAGAWVSLSGVTDPFVCTGYDDAAGAESAGQHDAELRAFAEVGATMLCLNPDRVVVHGDGLKLCAGTLADRYEAMGGSIIYFGKPHAPIYDHVFAWAAAELGRPVDRRRVLAIGDAFATDYLGAVGQGIDFAFITGGIEADALGAGDAAAYLAERAAEHGVELPPPVAVAPTLG